VPNYNSFLSPSNNDTYNGTNTIITFSGSGLAGTGPYDPGMSPVPHFGFAGVVPDAITGGERWASAQHRVGRRTGWPRLVGCVSASAATVPVG